MSTDGLNALFKGCLARFVSIPALVAVGRKLSWEDQSTRPWTEFEVTGFDTQDGFSDDVEINSIRFTFHGKYPTPDKATEWVEQMTDAFDDATGISVVGFTTSGVNRVPNSDNITKIEGTGIFEAEVQYDFWLHRDTLLPAVRGA